MNIKNLLKLRSQMILVFGILTLIQAIIIGLLAIRYIQESLEEQIGNQAVNVASTIASIPQVISAIEEKNTSFLQPVSLEIARQVNAKFVVVGDREGIRIAHPNADRIGFSMQDDEGDDNAEALARGNSYISKALGHLGWTMRGKVPVYDAQQNIIGIVSVGYELKKIEAIIDEYRLSLTLAIIGTFVMSAMISVLFANYFKKAIFGLEPHQIARLFDEQKAILESVREGIIAINSQGEITTVNKTAIHTLGLPDEKPIIGRKIAEVFDDVSMLDVLKTGKPHFDQDVWHNRRHIIANRLPLKNKGVITGVVSSFRRKDELDLVSKQLTRIKQYADSLHSQAHEYSNKLHTIAGLIQIGAHEDALVLIGQESQSHQALISLLSESVPDPIIAGCLLGKYNRAKELGLRLVIDKDSHVSTIPDYIPRENLVSIMGNLLDNAFEATLKNKEHGGEITLSMSDVGNDLIIEIEDQGGGIIPDKVDSIFEKGFSSKKELGHGIGLYLVKTLLDSINGTITVHQIENSGSRFTLYIPKEELPK